MKANAGALALLVSMVLASQAPAATWRVETRTDPFSDERITGASVEAAGGYIMARCTGQVLQAYAGFRGLTADSSLSRNVRYRVDKAEPSEERWEGGPPDVVWAPRPLTFLRELQAGEAVVIETQDYFGQPLRITVSLAGSRAAIDTVLTACGNPTEEPIRAGSFPATVFAPITNPQWISKPTPAEVAAASPAPRMHGRATLECMVAAEGLLTGCAVVSEAPVGVTFGAAALTLAAKYRMRDKMRDGQPTEGHRVVVRVLFVPAA